MSSNNAHIIKINVFLLMLFVEKSLYKVIEFVNQIFVSFR